MHTNARFKDTIPHTPGADRAALYHPILFISIYIGNTDTLHMHTDTLSIHTNTLHTPAADRAALYPWTGRRILHMHTDTLSHLILYTEYWRPSHAY